MSSISVTHTEEVDPAELTAFPGNPRRGNLDVIKESLTAHGQYRSVLVNERTGHVLAGNHTVEAAVALGFEKVSVNYIDVPADAEAKIVAMDNRTTDLAAYDDRALADLLGSLPELDGTGFDDAALSDLLGLLDPVEPGGDTEPMEVPPEPRTKLGDLYVLGEHRLLCGDSTVAADVERLMDGERAQMLFTDPPYGVMHGGAKKNAISGDLSQALIPISFAVAVDQALDDDARLYVCGGSGNYTMYAKLFDHHLQQQPHLIVWVKESFVMRPNGYHSRFELVYYGWKGVGGGSAHWYGDRKHSDVWHVTRDPDAGHPTQKPVELCGIAIGNSCPPGGVIFEPFGGSGSTLIACENLGRKAYLCEIDPGYCDVIVDRFQRHTSKTATLESSATL